MPEVGVIVNPKVNGGTPPNSLVQFCISFRKINSILKFDTYPMLMVDELLE